MADDVTVDNGAEVDYSVATQEMADGSHVQEISLVHVDLNTSSQVTKAEDTPSAMGDPGMPLLGSRNDNGTATTDTDGDYTRIATDSAGRIGVSGLGSSLNVAVTSTTTVTPGTGPTNLGKAEDSAHVSGDVGVMSLAVRNDSAAATLTSTDGDYSPMAVDGQGRLFVTADTDSPVTVNVNSTTTVTPGTGATNLGKAEDAAHTSGDVGVMLLGVRNDSASQFSGTDGDYTPISVDRFGNVNVNASTPGGLTSVTYVDSGSLWDGFSGATAAVSYAKIAVSSSGDTTLVAAPGSGNQIRVLSLSLISNGSVNVKFIGGSTDITGLYYLIANSGFILPQNDHGWFQGGNNEAIKINLSAAIAVGGSISYVTLGTA